MKSHDNQDRQTEPTSLESPPLETKERSVDKRETTYQAPHIIKSWQLTVRAIGGSPPIVP